MGLSMRWSIVLLGDGWDFYGIVSGNLSGTYVGYDMGMVWGLYGVAIGLLFECILASEWVSMCVLRIL